MSDSVADLARVLDPEAWTLEYSTLGEAIAVQDRRERSEIYARRLIRSGHAVVKLPKMISGDLLGISVWRVSGDRYARTQIDGIDNTISILDVPNPIATPEDALSPGCRPDRRRTVRERIGGMTDLGDVPIYSRNDLRRIGYALLQVPHTGDIEFEGGRPPSEPTPDLLVDMLTQLRDILRAKMPALTEVEQLVWAAWNALPDDERSPVKRIARDLGMKPADVAFIVFPAEQFGRWEDDQEPDLD